MDEDDQEDPENDFEFVALPSQNGDIIVRSHFPFYRFRFYALSRTL
jgi:hypothetical protein